MTEATVTGQAVSFRRAVASVWERRTGIVLVSLAGALVAAMIGAVTTPRYSATALVLASPLESSVLGVQPATTGLSSEMVVLDTQIQLMTSPAQLDRAAAVLLRSETAEALRMLLADEIKIPGLTADQERAALRRYLSRNLAVRQKGRAEMIAVSFAAPDPEIAAAVANTVADTFLAEQAADRLSATHQIGNRLEARVDELAAELAQAQDDVRAYRAESGLVVPRGVQENRLAEIDRALIEAEVALATQEQRLARLSELRASGERPDADPLVRSSAEIAAIRNEERQALATGSAGEDRLAEFDRRIEREVDRIVAEIEVQRDLAASTVAALRDARADAITALTDLADHEVGLARLQDAADVAARIHARMVDRLREVREEEFFIKPDARLVSRALPPTAQDNPGVVLLAAMGFIGFAMLGVVAALVIGMWRDGAAGPADKGRGA